SKYIFSFLFLLVFSIVATEISAQTRISSPYSRFGIGDIYNSYNARSLAMGGIGFSLQSDRYINFLNPASFAGFKARSFVFEGGINSNFVKLETDNKSQKSNYTSLGYLAFGFPVTKWWGSSFGLLPYSNIGYKISSNDSLQNIGNVNYKFEGEGGINRLYWGNSFELIDSTLSIGFNASYLFGSLDRIRTAVFLDSLNYFDIKITDSRIVNGVMLSYGLQYRKKLKPKNSERKIILFKNSNQNKTKQTLFFESGFTFNMGSKISAKKESLTERIQLNTFGLEIIQDTIENITDIKGDIKIPLSFGAGIALRGGNKWLIGFDYSIQNWSDYTSFGEIDTLANSMNAAFGAEYTPKYTNLPKYWEKIHYRVGARYSKTYLQIRDNQLLEYAASFGLGAPIFVKVGNQLKEYATLNIGVELGKRGTTDNDLILENFTRITFGIVIKDFLARPRKYE
ncbi:MAG: hypothetical protein H8E98_01745, partial [Bacteroidetes bacterium]|nr:hypothetical protein [Bacteroidota bacterium]